MKINRNFRILLLILTLVLALSACSEKGNTSEKDGNSNSSTVDRGELSQEEFMDSYIEKIAKKGDAEEFYRFWFSINGYCNDLEKLLAEKGNTDSYEFDPNDEASYPEEFKEEFDFYDVMLSAEALRHSDYNVKIDGEKVEFYFDGYMFYPSELKSSEVKKIVNKYNK